MKIQDTKTTDKHQSHGAREMAQWLRVLTAFAEDPRLNPSTHIVANNCL